jgi:ATP-binding cassette subfamily B protein
LSRLYRNGELKAILLLKKAITSEDGQIIEKGDHDTLIEEKGKYYKLYTGQFELS